MTGNDLASLLPLVLIVVVFWLLVLRPARRRQREAAQLQRALAVGDQVMLTSGILGTVTSLADDRFDLEIAPGVVIAAMRPAVARVVPPEPGTTPDGEPRDEAPPGDGPDDRHGGRPVDDGVANDNGGGARP